MSITRTAHLLLPLWAIALAVGCASGPRQRIPDALLSGIEPGKIVEIQYARAQRDISRAEELEAEERLAEALAELRVSRAELEVARSEEEQARTQVRISRSAGNTRAVHSSEDRLAIAVVRVEERLLYMVLQQRRVEYARAKRAVARSRTEHLDAELQLVKALALAESPRGSRLRVARFESQMDEFECRLERAKQELACVRIELAEAEDDWLAVRSRLEALLAPSRAALDG